MTTTTTDITYMISISSAGYINVSVNNCGSEHHGFAATWLPTDVDDLIGGIWDLALPVDCKLEITKRIRSKVYEWNRQHGRTREGWSLNAVIEVGLIAMIWIVASLLIWMVQQIWIDLSLA